MIGALRRRRARHQLEREGADPRLINYLSLSFAPDRKKTIQSTRFVVLDTETTGLDPSEDRLLSLAAVGVCDGSIHLKDRLEVTFFGASVGGVSAAPIHGLVTRDLYGGCAEPEGLLKLLTFLGADVLVAHHAAFDVAVLSAALGRVQAPPLANAVVDTGHLARRLEKGAVMGDPNPQRPQSLDALAARFGFDIPHRHSASGDALVTAQVLLALLHLAERRGIKLLGELLAR